MCTTSSPGWCRPTSDGKWRALDTVSLRGQLPAMQAIAAAHVECGLAREFGVAWVARADGAGNEIRGITQAQMDAYSSRTEAIQEATPAARGVVDGAVRPGAEPARAAAHPAGGHAGHARGQGRRRRSTGTPARRGGMRRSAGSSRRVAPAVSTPARPRQQAAAPGARRAAVTGGAGRAARTALAVVQAKQSTWTSADLLKQIGLAIPAEAAADGPAGGGRAAAFAGGPGAGRGVRAGRVRWRRRQWPAVPDYLRRDLDGRCVYTRPGTQRYATRVQLSLEERLLAQAQRQGAPRLQREDAAQHLGADADVLDAQLLARAQEARASADVTGSGLRLDQAAALHHVLTSPRVAEVLVGPAGQRQDPGAGRGRAGVDRSGTGRASSALATAQAARNVLAAAGVELAENTVGVPRARAGPARGARHPGPCARAR